MKNNLDPWVLTPEQVAEVLSLSRSTAYHLIETGELPSVRIGRLRRVRKVDLERWVEEHMSTVHKSS